MAAETIWSAVGRQPALNAKGDQEVVQNLLNRIPRSLGGAEGSLQIPPQAGQVSAALQAAIEVFQQRNVSGPYRDGRVDPNAETIQKLKQLAASSSPAGSSAQPGGGSSDFEITGVP